MIHYSLYTIEGQRAIGRTRGSWLKNSQKEKKRRTRRKANIKKKCIKILSEKKEIKKKKMEKYGETKKGMKNFFFYPTEIHELYL